MKRREFITLLGGAAAWVYAGIVSASGGTRNRGRAAACDALKMTKEERAIVEYLERSYGRPLTPQEIYLSLQQARQIGNLDGEPDGPLPPLCGVVFSALRAGARP